ncbi:MAG: hypothetical protein ACLRT4_07025 [Thomasclavelia sp.]
MITIVNEYIRNDFIKALMEFSNGKISEKEANRIADKKLRLTDFSDDSPLAHKGPRWLAKRIVRYMFE